MKHFLLYNCSKSTDFYDYRYLYPEVFLIKTDYYSENVIVTTKNNKFLKKCIKLLTPLGVELLNRNRYKELEIMLNLKQIVIT